MPQGFAVAIAVQWHSARLCVAEPVVCAAARLLDVAQAGAAAAHQRRQLPARRRCLRLQQLIPLLEHALCPATLQSAHA